MSALRKSIAHTIPKYYEPEPNVVTDETEYPQTGRHARLRHRLAAIRLYQGDLRSEENISTRLFSQNVVP